MSSSTDTKREFIAHLILEKTWILIIAFILLTLLLFPGLTKLSFNDDYRMYFSKDNKDLVAWDNLLDTYTRTDSAIVTVNTTDGSKIFSADKLVLIRELTDDLWQLEHVARVDSISNFQYMFSRNDELVVEDLVKPEHLSDSALITEREIVANNEPSIKGRMLSDDGRTTAIYLQMRIPKEMNAIAHVAENLKKVQSDTLANHSGISIKLGGVVMLNAAFDEYAREDMATLFPLMMLLIIVLMFWIFRSLKIVFINLGVIILNILITLGIAGYLGIAFSPHSAIAPQVILIVTVATNMHIIVTFLKYYAQFEDKGKAITKTLKDNLFPVFLTTFTTALGFFSMLFSDVPPFNDLGIMAGIGVLNSFVLSIFLLPAILYLVRFDISKIKNLNFNRKSWTTSLGHLVLEHRKVILLVAGLIIIPILYGVSQLKVDDHPVKLFSEGTTFRDNADFIDDNLAGTTTIQFSLDSGKTQGITDPEFMTKIEAFKQFLLDDGMVRHVQILSDTVKRINKAIHNDDEKYYEIPVTKEEISQYILFYESNLPFGLDINNEINIDKSSVRLIATIRSSSSSEIIQFLDRTDNWLAQNNSEFETRGVSVLVMFSYMAERLANNMMLTGLIAISSIAIVLMFAFRSIKLGLLSMIPNLIPIILVFGLWSLIGNTLDFGASLIFSMTLGVVVDDTVHFLSRFVKRIKQHQESTHSAIVSAIEGVGNPIVYSTLILAGGFLVFTLSNFHMNSTLGSLTALTFIIALLFDLLILPILVYYIGIKSRTTSRLKGIHKTTQVS